METRWIFIFLEIVFVIFIIILGVNLLLNVDLTKSINLKGETNDFCQSLNNSQSSNSLDYLACDNKFKKNKIILFLIDSLPFDNLHILTDVDKSRITNFFRGKGLDYKQSGALFETILTGKFSRNYAASHMEFDSLAQQFKNAKMDVYYKIRNFPVGQLVGKNLATKFELHKGEVNPLSRFCENNVKFFEKYTEEVHKNFVDDSISSFKEGLNEDLLYKRANEDLKAEFDKMHTVYTPCFSKNDFYSTVFYTDCLDHFIHTSYKTYPIVIYKIFYTEQVLKQIIKWINEEHSEYALAMASDHGGQIYYGEDALCNHGCNHPGNEATLFTYTKELGENYEQYKMVSNRDEIPLVSLNDFPCIIAQTVKNVNLPLETTCTPRFIGNDPIIKFSSIKSKEIQLKKYVEKLCNKYPELNEEYHGKYDKKLNGHKFLDYFKDMDTIIQTEDKIFNEYRDYLMNVQDELLTDVIKSSHSQTYYTIFYISAFLFIFGFVYHFRNLILLTRNKILKIYTKNSTIEKEIVPNPKEDIKENGTENIILSKLVRYIIIIFILLLSEPIACFVFHNSLNISNFINFAVFFKFIGLLCFISMVTVLNNLQQKKNYKKAIYILTFIIILHFIMCYIELFIYIDKNVNNDTKSDFIKFYLSYPLLFLYAATEFYSFRNYYIYKIRYIYIISFYLIFASYFMIKFDKTIKIHMGSHEPETVFLMRSIYLMIFLLLIFIKPLKKKKNEDKKVIPNVIFNSKLFFIVVINFICIETERVPMVLLFNFMLFYLCRCFKKEKDIFLKLFYLIIIACYTQIFYVGNQGTYTMDLSIKVAIKVPSQWADDLPVISGIIFTVHKLKYHIISSSYVFGLFKRTKNKTMNYYSEIARLIYIIQLYGRIICYLYFLKNEIEHSYIQTLFLIAAESIPLCLYDIDYLINYGCYKIVRMIYKEKEKKDYKQVNEIEEPDNSLIPNKLKIANSVNTSD